MRQQCFLCIDSTAPEGDQRVAWGLEPDPGTFFHWGDAGRYMSFAAGSVAKRSGVVVLVNGANGMVIMLDLVATDARRSSGVRLAQLPAPAPAAQNQGEQRR